MSFAQIQLLGNCGRDPEMNYTPDGVAICKFSIAVSRKVKGNEETTWYNCIAWRNLAEMLSTHLKKGNMVFVQGDLNARQYTTKDGRNGVSLDVTVDKFQFAGGKREESSSTPTTHHDDSLRDLNEHPF
jgi:single-strand DNA-binding protein